MKKSILLLFLAISNVVMSQTGTLSNEGMGKQSLCVDTKGVPLPAKALRVLPSVIGHQLPAASSYITCVGYKAGCYITNADYVFLIGSDSVTIN